MKLNSKYVPEQYYVDNEASKVFIVVTNYTDAINSSNWCGRYYPAHQCQFISNQRFQQITRK